MAGERLIHVIDIARFRAIRPALDELDAARALSFEARAVLQEAAASPFARRDLGRFAGLLARILRHPELELRVFLAPGEVDVVIEGVMHVLCFENGADFSLVTPVGPNWVVLDSALAVFGDLDWFRTIFFRPFVDSDAEDRLLAYPRAGLEGRYYILSREDVVSVAAELRPLLDDPIPTEITALLAARAEQLHARHVEEISAAKEAMTALLQQRPDLLKPDVYNDLIVAYRNGSPVRIRDVGRAIEAPENDLLAMALSQEVRPAAEGLARLAAKALSRDELTLAHTSLL